MKTRVREIESLHDRKTQSTGWEQCSVCLPRPRLYKYASLPYEYLEWWILHEKQLRDNLILVFAIHWDFAIC